MEEVGLLVGLMEGALIVHLDGQRNGKRTFRQEWNVPVLEHCGVILVLLCMCK